MYCMDPNQLRSMKHQAACLLFALCFAANTFAGGTKEEDFRKTEGLENWESNYDISGLDPGKYNLLIEGKDSAGNTAIAGPYNVYVDPKSDLPVVSISNPTLELRVGGDLNIVGTCVDDDAVDHVEIKIDEGEFIKAEGKEFWSYLLDVTSELAVVADGPRKVTARGVDINGVVGLPVSVRFNLDTLKPFVKMMSHESGTLASGSLKLSGITGDANGVRGLSYSTDGRKTYRDLSLRASRDRSSAQFDFTVDTKRLPDGPQVYWFRAVDLMGSVGEMAFLFFVDNTGPALEILKPKKDEKVSGKVTVAGKVTELIGIKSFSYDAGGGNTGVIDLIPGNPYWTRDFDFTSARPPSARITFTILDLAGNRTVQQVSFALLPDEADLPVVTLRSPVAGGKYSGDMLLAGAIRDDDGVKGLRYSLDGKEVGSLETKESFSMILSGIAPGKHKLALRGIDANGRAGRDAIVEFVSTAAPPAVMAESVTKKSGSVPYRHGLEVGKEESLAISGRIVSLAKIQTVEISFNGAPAEKLSTKRLDSPGASGFDARIPASVPYGLVEFVVRATDVYSQSGEFRGLVHVTNRTKRNIEPGLYFLDPRIGTDGSVVLRAETPLVGFLAEEQIAEVSLEPPTRLATVTWDGEWITVKPVAAGISSPVKVRVTTKKNHVFTSREMRFLTDAQKPVISLSRPKTGEWLSGKLTIAGQAADETGIRILEYSLDGMKSFTRIGTPESARQFAFDFAVPLESVPDGLLHIAVRCTDLAGNTALTHAAILKDATPPSVTIRTPAEGAELGGRFVLWGTVADDGIITKVELSTDGQSYSDLAGRGTFWTVIDPSGIPQLGTLIVRATDASGNTAEARISVRAAAAGQPAAEAAAVPAAAPAAAKDTVKPALELLYPPKDAKLNSRIAFIGTASDTQGLKRISYDAGAERKGEIEILPGSPYWGLELDFGSERGSRTVVFTAEDQSANKTEVRYALALDEASDQPKVAVVQPENKAVAEGDVVLYGRVRDDEAVRAMYYAVDGGQETELPGGNAFAATLTGLASGARRLSVRAVDENGLSGPKMEIAFSAVGAGPSIRATGVVRGKESSPYLPGMMTSIDKETILTGIALVPNAPKSAEFSIQGAAAKQLALRRQGQTAEYAFDIPLSADLPFAKTEIRISVTDATDRKSEYVASLYRTEKDPGGSNDAEGIILIDSRMNESGSILLAPGDVVAGYFNGRPIKEAALDPRNDVLSVEFDGNFLKISALKEGLVPQVRVRLVTIDGDAFATDPHDFRSDAAPPLLAIASPLTGDWASERITVKGTVSDVNGVDALEYSVGDTGAYTRIETVKIDAGFSFEAPIDITGLPDGDTSLAVRARDAAGRESILITRFMKDTKPPVMQAVTPPEGDSVNGRISLTVSATDEGRIDLVEFSEDGQGFAPVAGFGAYSVVLDLSKYQSLPAGLAFRARDASGNLAAFTPTLDIQQAKDVPDVQIQIPKQGDVLRNDFIISGMAFDDDGIGSISYRIDGGEPTSFPGSNSFSIPILLADITDNEHTIEVKADDLNGVPSEPRTATFKISKAEPASKLLSPSLDMTTRGMITLSGVSSDKNGIKAVYVSFDNGQSFNLASGRELWSYRLDTRILKDGAYSILVKAIDAYDTQGLFATLVNIDNTRPEIILDSPEDGSTISGTLVLDGRAQDNIALTTLKASLTPLGVASAKPYSYDLPRKGVFTQSIDIAGFVSGWYNLSLEATDKAENTTKISSSLLIQEKNKVDRLDIFFPSNGERISCVFDFAGKLETTGTIPEVTIIIDGKEAGVIPVKPSGIFYVQLDSNVVPDGEHIVEVAAKLPGDILLRSESRTISFSALGPWITIDSHSLRDFITSRPFIKGEAGFELPKVDATDKEAVARAQRESQARKVARVEISLDNGITFQEAQGREKWQYRLETQNFPDGDIRLIAKAVFVDGSIALDKTILNLDDTPPQVTLISPSEEGRFNDKIDMRGTARDANGIEDVRVAVRKGDKANYEVPTFIQGLYFDGHFLGATFWDFGAGLTFFDDNVKLQAQIGTAPDGRFSGLVLGAKLLANISTIPFSFLLGPDWDFLSMSFAVGANFSYVTNSGETIAFTDKGLILGAVVGQIEFPIVKIKSWPMFNTYSTYAEYQLWFISSDVSAGFVNRLAFGARVGLF